MSNQDTNYENSMVQNTEIQNNCEVKDESSKQKKCFNWKLFFVIIISVLALLYLSASLFFKTHYFYGTVIENVPCGLMTESKAKSLIESTIGQYELSIIGRENMEDTISAEEIDLEFHFGDSFYSILADQNCFGWIASFFQSYKYSLPRDVSYNEEKFGNVVNQISFLNKANQKQPKDAYIGAYNPSTGAYELMEEYPGTVIIKDSFVDAVKGALTSLDQRLDLNQVDCYKNPVKCSDDKKLNRLLNTLNKYVGSKIIYDWNGDEVVLDEQTISKWLSIDKNKVVLDEILLEEWVTEQAKLHDTYSSKREFTTYTGDVVTVNSSTFGWKTSKKTEINELKTLIRKGETVEREPEYLYTGYIKGQDDMGDSYVEINLSAQHLYLWIDGEVILETDFVSGNMSNGNGTPPGLFGITYKEKDAVLRGATYTTPVKYWMPFNGNIGMHDATWRKEFGGDIYLTSGSHGCINLPLSMAKEIFEHMEKRFPVVCYY